MSTVNVPGRVLRGHRSSGVRSDAVQGSVAGGGEFNTPHRAATSTWDGAAPLWILPVRADAWQGFRSISSERTVDRGWKRASVVNRRPSVPRRAVLVKNAVLPKKEQEKRRPGMGV